MTEVDIAISPCPNDTFAFHAWIHGLVPSPLRIRPHFADIQQLNDWAHSQRFPFLKVSAFCLGQVTEHYAMLGAGGALSHHGGPMLVARHAVCHADLAEKCVAVPGVGTTAHLLLQTLLPHPRQIVPCRYDEVVPLITENKVDAGVIIHETRFLLDHFQLRCIADLGALFSERSGGPVPLGMLIARRDMPQPLRNEVTRAIRASIAYAMKHPEASRDYVLEHSLEKDEAIVRKHIQFFVNEETLSISQKGIESIDTLFQLAVDHNLLPRTCRHFTFEKIYR